MVLGCGGNLGLFVGVADRARLAAIVADRNSAQKHVWRVVSRGWWKLVEVA